MTRDRTPTIYCDAEDGDCGGLDLDYYTLTVSTIDGVPVTREHRAPGWVSTDDSDLCPEHAEDESADTFEHDQAAGYRDGLDVTNRRPTLPEFQLRRF